MKLNEMKIGDTIVRAGWFKPKVRVAKEVTLFFDPVKFSSLKEFNFKPTKVSNYSGDTIKGAQAKNVDLFELQKALNKYDMDLAGTMVRKKNKMPAGMIKEK